jgi:predicted transcriptional regulator
MRSERGRWLVGRDVRRVHEDVGILSQLGLLERTEDAGVVCPYDCVHIACICKPPKEN